MRGGKHAHLVSAQLEVVHDGLASNIKRAGVVWWIEIRYDEDFHRA
jgi:hypothetical protein